MLGRAYRIATERLILRCWHPRDAPRLKAAVDENLEHLSGMWWIKAEPQTLDDKVALLRQFRARFDLGQELTYAIFDRAESAVLGGTGLVPRIGPHAAEIGYWIHRERIGQGLATEAAAAMTRVAFELEQLGRVEIHCGATNLASAAVARKLGYTHEATLPRRQIHPEDAPRDTMIWTLFADRYPASPAAKTSLQMWDAAERPLS
jgi:RimJ/RimL family protein N-acetyltransferase